MKFTSTALLLAGLAVFLAGAGLQQNEVQLASIHISNSDGDVLIRWEAEVEQGLKEYVLKRQTPYTNRRFEEVARVTAHGPHKPYTYRDREVYKSASEKIEYRLGVEFQDGSTDVKSTETVNYEPTAVRRTWGSIKAMFQ